MFRQSKEINANSPGAIAIIGGSYLLFADRLPESERKNAWDVCYDNYQALYRLQKGTLERLPTHMRGELLAGLAQASQRTGRTEEFEGHLDKILELLPKTGYSRTASLWKADPELAKSGSIGCKSCHSPGRLSSHLARLGER